MMPLTLASSIWGMNTWVPGDSEPLPFYYTIIGMVVIAAIIMYYIKKHNMLLSGEHAG